MSRGSSGLESKTTSMFRRACQVAAPGAKSAVPYRIFLPDAVTLGKGRAGCGASSVGMQGHVT